MLVILCVLALCCAIGESASCEDASLSQDMTRVPPVLETDAATAVTVAGGKLDARLPRSLKPVSYVVKLQPFVNGNFSILGHVEVEMEVLEPTYNITINMADIITRNETVKVFASGEEAGVGIPIARQEYDPLRQFYIAHLNEELQNGKKYVLSMDFIGLLNDQLRGFYRSSYKDEVGKTRRMASTQFSPTDARRAFPCFDEPGLKAIFKVSLARETWMTALSNMPVAETVPLEGQEGWVWDHFERTVPMSTYLVGFMVTDFSYINVTQDGGVLFKMWARKAVINDTEYSGYIGPKILNFFEDYFNISFPLPKQDMIAVPALVFSAMENWGLITYRESRVLFDPLISTPASKETLASVVAHELAHQWFGNLVTPAWWDDLWLKEGFATFMSYVALNHVEPTWRSLEDIVISTVQYVFNLDSLESSHPISVPVDHPDQINEIFDAISYKKGSSIVRMMSYFLSDATFRKGLNNYLNALKFKNAKQDDLWDFLTIAAHQDDSLPQNLTVKMVMDTWTLQMGYPVIHVLRTPEGSTATVSQERFLLSKSVNSTDSHTYLWWVPLSYTWASEGNFNQTQARVWMSDSQENITITTLPSRNQWVIFNLQETGYYRVNYDEDNWNLLIQQLKDNHKLIHTVNRGQIIDDAMNLARAEQLGYKIAMGTLSYLAAETEYLPWASADRVLKYIDVMFRRKGAYGALKQYIRDLVLPLYESVGFEDSAGDSFLQQKKRRIAVYWACRMGHLDCLERAVALYRRWMAEPDNERIISPNLKSTIYCTAIAEGGVAEWDFGWQQYLKTEVAGAKTVLLGALACSKEHWILSRYLDVAITPDGAIDQQDVQYVLESIGRNDIGRQLVWDYLAFHWNEVFNFKKKRRGDLLKSVTSSFNTPQDLVYMNTFLNNEKNDFEGNILNSRQATEKIENNISWMETNYDVIKLWLEENGYSSTLISV